MDELHIEEANKVVFCFAYFQCIFDHMKRLKFKKVVIFKIRFSDDFLELIEIF